MLITLLHKLPMNMTGIRWRIFGFTDIVSRINVFVFVYRSEEGSWGVGSTWNHQEAKDKQNPEGFSGNEKEEPCKAFQGKLVQSPRESCWKWDKEGRDVSEGFGSSSAWQCIPVVANQSHNLQAEIQACSYIFWNPALLRLVSPNLSCSILHYL